MSIIRICWCGGQPLWWCDSIKILRLCDIIFTYYFFLLNRIYRFVYILFAKYTAILVLNIMVEQTSLSFFHCIMSLGTLVLRHLAISADLNIIMERNYQNIIWFSSFTLWTPPTYIIIASLISGLDSVCMHSIP